MGLIRTIFNKKGGGLGRPPSNSDYISSLLFYGNVPSGWSPTGVEEILSLSQLEDKGINGNSFDAISATSVITVSGAGAEGDKIGFIVSTLSGSTDFGVYTVGNAPTVTTVADGLVLLINSNTATHGYTATNVSGVITLVAPKRAGKGANSNTNLFATIGTVALATTTDWGSGVVGVGSIYDVWYYHAKEYFRQISNGKLFIGIFPTPTVWDFKEIETIQNIANGEVRQFGFWDSTRTIVSNGLNDVTAIEAIYDTQFNTIIGRYRPFVALYASDISAVVDINTLPDTTTFDAEHCSLVIGQDANAEGLELYNSLGKSITTLGACLGAVSKASVFEDIAWPEKFDMSVTGGELDKVSLSNGQNLDGISQNELVALKDKSYLFQIKRDSTAGTYNIDSLTATIQTSDYFSIENNRTIDKAVRLVNGFMTTKLASPVYVQEDGTLQESTLQVFKQGSKKQLDTMEDAGEVSASAVLIDPNQNVLSTSCIELSIVIVPVGVAREIKINIGYELNIT